MQICARMTNVGPNAPHGPLNGSGPNVHVFESSLPVGCSRAVNVHVCHLKNFTTAANTTLYPPGQTPPHPPMPSTFPQNMDFPCIFQEKMLFSAAVALANSALFKVSLWRPLCFCCWLPWKRAVFPLEGATGAHHYLQW